MYAINMAFVANGPSIPKTYSVKKDKLIQNIILNENAYFFLKEKKGFISKRLIKNTFKEASAEKKGNFLTGRHLLNQNYLPRVVGRVHSVARGEREFSNVESH